MTRANPRGPRFDLDPEIERTQKQLKRRIIDLMDVSRNNGQPPADGQNLTAQADGAIIPPAQQMNQQLPARTVRDYLAEDLDGLNPAVTMSDFEAEHFKLKPVMFSMLNTLGQFGGTPNENARQHLKSFLEICNSFKIHGVSNDVLKLKLFPYSSRNKAKTWLNNLQPGSLQSWTQLCRSFLAKLSYTNMTDHLRNQITSFSNHDASECGQQVESSCYVGNYNKNTMSNTYNPAWRNHPNFSWKNQNNTLNPQQPTQTGFQNQPRQNQQPLPRQEFQQPTDYKSLENTLTQFMAQTSAYMVRTDRFIQKTDAFMDRTEMKLQNHDATLKSLETQVGQISQILSSRPIGGFPSDTKVAKGAAHEQCNATETFLALMHNKVPAKKTDPGSFTTECFIGNNYPTKALCDPGVIINLMPKSVFQKLGIGEAKPTTVMLQLAYHSYVQPEGKIEDIFVQEAQEERLIATLRQHKEALGWSIADIKGISPAICMHKILLEDDHKPTVDAQRRLNQAMKDVVRKEILKWLDAGYNQIAIAPEDQSKTTFTCPYGTFAFRRMPFGLCNAPATFQRCMTAIFSDLNEDCLEIFMDDFSTFGDNFDNCLSNLEKVLKRC
ncbi:hypothetical protein GQ457_09G021580 [Hibiscus cannabinus]